MRSCHFAVVLFAIMIVVGFRHAIAGADENKSELRSTLNRDFDLGKKRGPGTTYFDVVTTWVGFAPDGTRGDTETYRVLLECVSEGDAVRMGDRYTCKRFVYTKPDGTQIDIPALKGWTYTFKRTPTGFDENGHVFGIDHSRFDKLTDDRGDPLGPDKSYLIYNTFIDFHAFCDTFATPVAEGHGIQHLTRVGQRVVHAASHSKPPTNLGDNFKKGSWFKNGEITLEFKGLGLVDDSACAVVGFDSGNSSFQMLMEPTLGMEVKSIGGSHYFGDMYLDIASRWPRRVDLHELVVSQTNVPMPGDAKPMTINSIQERMTLIRSLTKEEFEKE